MVWDIPVGTPLMINWAIGCADDSAPEWPEALSRAELDLEQLDEWCIDALGRGRPPVVWSAATRPSCPQSPYKTY